VFGVDPVTRHVFSILIFLNLAIQSQSLSADMKSLIVSYADDLFLFSQKRLIESALHHGIDESHSWDRAALEQTTFYKLHKSTLDSPRGGGYWLWKPFIIKEELEDLKIGDILVYSDAGIEIIGALSPLLKLCLQKGILPFAGHYDDFGAPGPNICSKWTKRDCFVFMGSDELRYHQSQMLDASFLVLTKTEKSMTFIREWFLYCNQPQLLTDQPNICGLPDLPDFIGHRYDQSILSLLAARKGIEIFRHPSQFGNHLKDEPYREPGESKRYPYGAKGIYYNSPYKTLLNHHRGNLGSRYLPPLLLRWTLQSPCHQVFNAWTRPEELKKWLGYPNYVVTTAEINLQVGGKYCLTVIDIRNNQSFDITGNYIEIIPSKKLAFSFHWSTRVTIEFHEGEGITQVVLIDEQFFDERVRYRHLTYWNNSLARLAEVLSASY